MAEFVHIAEGDATIDHALDDRLTDRARDGDVLLESRLAGWLATRAGLPALRVWIACDDVERARRVGGSDGHGLDEAVDANRAREASEKRRYQGYYEIDLDDLSIYDLVLDSKDRDPDALVADIVTEATSRFS